MHKPVVSQLQELRISSSVCGARTHDAHAACNCNEVRLTWARLRMMRPGRRQTLRKLIIASASMPSYVLQPEVLDKRQIWVLRLALPLLFSVLACGIAGLFILIDHEQQSPLSQTRAASLYRRLIAFNPLISAICVNAPILGLIYVLLRLRNHSIAVQQRHTGADLLQSAVQAKQAAKGSASKKKR